MIFPAIMYGCKSWTIKKAEHWRTDAFELWCWRRHLRLPWTARSNKSVIKEINPEYSLEGLMLKLKLPYWPPDVKSWFIWEDPDAGKDRRQEEKGTTEDEMVGWHHRLDGHEFDQAPGDGEGQEMQSRGLQRVGHDWATEQQQQHLLISGLCISSPGWTLHGVL